MMQVDVLPTLRQGRVLVLRARVDGHPRGRKRNGTVFFEVPAELSDWLVIQDEPGDLHDALVRAVLFSAMEAGRDVCIHGRVAASLLDGLEVYQRVIAAWWPHYRPVRIRADQEVTDASPPRGRAAPEAILAFSGGLDSIYSLYRHQRRQQGRLSRSIPACVFVHGFDIPLRDRAFERAGQRAHRITGELNSRLVPVRTNLKELLPSWPQSHPAALAAVLSLFGRRFREGMIAPSVRYDNPYMHLSGHGSSPLSDPLLSSDSFHVFHDVADKTRVEKTLLLRDFDTARRHLRVCWQGQDLATNCGQCNKCLWQMLCLEAVGCRDFSAFQRPLTALRVARMQVASRAHWEELRACHEHAQGNGRGRSDVFRALAGVINNSESNLSFRADEADAGQAHHHRRRWRSAVSRVLGAVTVKRAAA